MTGLLLLLITGLMLSYVLTKDPEEVFPPYVMSLLLGIYTLAILKKSHHAFTLSLIAFAAIAVLFAVTLIRRLRNRPPKSPAETNAAPASAALRAALAGHVGFIVFVAVCLIMMWCYHTHFVHVWDDFHYNATFPKDCYYFGTMPTGYQSATFYKSYLPLQQLFFYWGFQGSGFSEALMFQYKMVLIYTLLLPLFAQINHGKPGRRICVGLATAILPFLFLYEVQESLSMDMVIAALFAYALIRILQKGKRDYLLYYSIFVSLLCLTLMKTISFFFTGIALGVWLFTIRDHKEEHDVRLSEWVILALSVLGSGAAYLSWNIFCKRNGNTTYLSNNLVSGLKEGIGLPEYAATTVKNMAASLVTLRCNLGPLGLSVLAMFVIATVVFAILTKKGLTGRQEKTAFTLLILGFAGYFAVLIYTYLFVFEPWEADSLSSLDRYLGTYAAAACAVLIRWLAGMSSGGTEKDQQTESGAQVNSEAQRSGAGKVHTLDIPTVLLAAVTVIFLVTLPYASLADTLIPSRYIPARADIWADRQEAAKEAASLMEEEKSGMILIVNDIGNTVYSRSMDYELIPLVARQFNMAEYEAGERKDLLTQRVLDSEPEYVYFTAHERAADDLGSDPAAIFPLPEEYTQTSVSGLYKRQ